MKELFWQYDRQKDTPAALNELIHDARNLDLNVYVLKYASITDTLIAGKEMFITQRVRRFLDGLSDNMRDKAFEFCTKQDWKLSSHDTGTKDPNFAELKKFILEKAQAARRKIVYNKERALEEGYDGLRESVSAIARPNSPVAPVLSPIVPTSVAPPPAATPTTPIDSVMAELSKQFSQLTLLLKANIESIRPTSPGVPTAPVASQVGAPFRPFNRLMQCM